MALVVLTAGLATARVVAAGTCTAKAPKNACGECRYESQCGGTESSRLCHAQPPKACKAIEVQKPVAPEPAAPAPVTTKAAPATPPVIAITATVAPKAAPKATPKVVEATPAPAAEVVEVAPAPVTTPSSSDEVGLDGSYVPTQSHGVLGLGAGFDIEGDHLHEAFSLGCTTTLSLASVKKDEAEVKLIERFGRSCRPDARPAAGATVGSIDTLRRGPNGEALELLVEMPAMTRVRRAFRAARLGDGDYKATDDTWVQLRGTAAIVRRGSCLVLARMADRGATDSADLRLIEVSGCDDISPAPGATVGKVSIAKTAVVDAEEITTDLKLELKGAYWTAARQQAGPPLGMQRGVTSNWTGAYDGPKGGTLTLLAPHAGTYALNDGTTTCSLPLEVAQVNGSVEARVSTAMGARIRPVGCPAYLPGQLAFRLDGLKTTDGGSLQTVAHNGMAFTRPGPSQQSPARPERPRKMVASIRGEAPEPVAASASPRFARGGVSDALKAGKKAVDACYQRRVQMRRGLAGSLFLAWQVDGNGTAYDVRVLKDSLGDGPTARCVVHAVRRMQFPAAPDGTYEVRTPFRFTAY
ncbi:MAG: AgmX/PglI C-terminal domain-containing protein [Myxococcota bacterium]